MKRNLSLGLSIVILGLYVTSAYAAQSRQELIPQEAKPVQKQAEQPRNIEIRLHNLQFDPLTKVPSAMVGLKAIQPGTAGKAGYYIVQFDGPVQGEWKKALTDMGVKIFDYVPDFAFIVKMDSAKEADVRSTPHVRWLGVFQPSYKMSPAAMDRAVAGKTDSSSGGLPAVRLHISVFSGENVDGIKSGIAAKGGTVLTSTTTAWGTTMKVSIPRERIDELPYVDGIRWIEPEPAWELYNNVSTDVMSARVPRDSYSLYGTGQTVGIADTGLDTGSIGTLHLDFGNGAGGSRVLSILDLAGDGASDVNSGHGTHVAGSVLGNGAQSGSNPSANSFPSSCFAGIAPKANLVFQALEDASGSLTGIPDDLNTLFSQSQAAGANLHTNSWGSSVMGMYTTESQNVDQYMWDHKDFLVLFSAGNSGVDLDRDGVIDLWNIGSPGTAKNCLTVGASEGNRPHGSTPTPGYDTPWGTGSWLVRYAVDPILTDHVSNNPLGMAAFSSRGPTLDGRYKPDIVAPGTNILSTRSSVATGSLWGDYNALYRWSGGTSMSTPLTAGAAALMREYLTAGGKSASAALIKASLLNSATNISPGQYGTGSYLEIPGVVPNNVEGWGRVDIGNGTNPVAPYNIIYADNQTGLNTGESLSYNVYVSDSVKPFKVNLAWTDYPGTPAAQGGLVNDLDLTVTDPAAVVHYPDNAVHEATVGTFSYIIGTFDYYSYDLRDAIRVTPSSYPAKVDSATFYFYNSSNTVSPVSVAVYAADGTGGAPGTELFRKSYAYMSSGWHTTGVTGATITSGDFYVSIEKNSTAMGIILDTGNPSGKCYYYDGSAWYSLGYTPWITANVRGVDISTSYDRTNNTEGITLGSPASGVYTITVNGYNVPNGPQPYALVTSGNVSLNVPITIATSPSGLQITVDSTAYTSPQTFYWEMGSSHTIGVASPQSGVTGTQYLFSTWSDSNPQTHSITVPAAVATYTANFTTQYLLTTSVLPSSTGSVTPNCSGGCWYNSGASISLSPAPSGSNTFASWTGDIPSFNAPLLFSLSAPRSITANFSTAAVTGTVRIAGPSPVYYGSIPLAYGNTVNNDVIQMRTLSYDGSLDFNRTGITASLKGGYNATYSDNTGQSTVGSPLTVWSGTIIMDNIVIK
jgi:hypothetical protein